MRLVTWSMAAIDKAADVAFRRGELERALNWRRLRGLEQAQRARADSRREHIQRSDQVAPEPQRVIIRTIKRHLAVKRPDGLIKANDVAPSTCAVMRAARRSAGRWPIFTAS